MCTFREVTVTLTAAEVMALTPILDHEIAYQRTYAGKQTIADELDSIKEKIKMDDYESPEDDYAEEDEQHFWKKILKGKKQK